MSISFSHNPNFIIPFGSRGVITIELSHPRLITRSKCDYIEGQKIIDIRQTSLEIQRYAFQKMLLDVNVDEDTRKTTHKSIFHQKSHSPWLPNARKNMTDNMKLTAQCEPQRLFNHIPSISVVTCIGLFGVCVGSLMVHIGPMRLLRYQHVGISNAKYSHWGSSPT